MTNQKSKSKSKSKSKGKGKGKGKSKDNSNRNSQCGDSSPSAALGVRRTASAGEGLRWW
jgi:hypothetical protein